MSIDLETVIRRAVPEPVPADAGAIWERGRRRRRGRMAMAGGLGAAVVAVLAVGLGLGSGDDGVSVQTDEAPAAELPPSTIATSRSGWTTVLDPDAGFTIVVPPGWTATTDNLIPSLGNPAEIFSAGTYSFDRPADPENQSAGCDAQIPAAAVEGGPDDAFVTIQDARANLDVFPPGATVSRQVDHLIGDGSFEFVPSRADLPCATRQRPGTEARWIWFGTETRSFYLAVVIGPDTSAETRRQLWQMLDSFRPI